MKLLIFTFADFASIEPETGKLNILGVFRGIRATTFPVVHRRMAIVLKLATQELEKHLNPHELVLALTDQDGIELMRINSPFEFNTQTSLKSISTENSIVIEVNNLGFVKPDTYRLYAIVDGEELGSIELIVEQLLTT